MHPLVHLTRRIPILAAVVAMLALPCGRLPAADRDIDLDIPLDGIEFVHPCTGELVTLHGNLGIRSDTTIAGDDVFITFHTDTHGVSATTSVLFPGEQPRKYVSDEIDNETFHVRFVAGPTTTQVETNWTFLRTGEADGIVCCGDDFLSHLTLHVTVVNGHPASATPSSVKAECK